MRQVRGGDPAEEARTLVVNLIATHLGEEFVPHPISATLVCSVLDRPVLDRINMHLEEDGANVTRRLLTIVAESDNSANSPKVLVSTGSWADDEVVDRLVGRVSVGKWAVPINVVLVVNYPTKPTFVFRFKPEGSLYMWRDV